MRIYDEKKRESFEVHTLVERQKLQSRWRRRLAPKSPVEAGLYDNGRVRRNEQRAGERDGTIPLTRRERERQEKIRAFRAEMGWEVDDGKRARANPIR